jgi:hypothetical protein
MPINTPGIKVESVRKLGGTVELVGESYQETQVSSLLLLSVWGKLPKAYRDWRWS